MLHNFPWKLSGKICCCCIVFETLACFLSDIDECGEDADICGGGQCENEEGGYRCICTDGLELSDDLITCRGITLQCINYKHFTTLHMTNVYESGIPLVRENCEMFSQMEIFNLEILGYSTSQNDGGWWCSGNGILYLTTCWKLWCLDRLQGFY